MFIDPTPPSFPILFEEEGAERNETCTLQDNFRSFFFERNCRRGYVAGL